MLNVILVLMLVGVFAVAGAKLLGPLAHRDKITATKMTLTSNVDAVVSWTTAHGRLPDVSSFAAAAQNPSDAWKNQLLYIFDTTLANTTTNNLCRLTATNLKSPTGTYLAFVLLSTGDDQSVESTWDGSPPLAASTPYYPATPPIRTISASTQDLLREVSLAELQSRAGCASTTPGRLTIANNELPNACAGSSTYPATLFADGGVPGYTWMLITPPAWLTINASSGALTPVTSITTATGVYPITIRLTDSQLPTSNTVQRTLNLKVQSCGCPGYRVWNATGTQYDFKLAAPCENNISNGMEITAATATPPRLLQNGGSIIRRSSQGNCNKPIQGQISYAQAVTADLNGDCMVNYAAGDTVTDRIGP